MLVRQVKPEYEQIVAAIPHCVGKPSWLYSWMTENTSKAEINKWTDWYTDELFGIEMPCVTTVKAKCSCLECDCERLEGETDRLLHFIPAKGASKAKYHHESSCVERNGLLSGWYDYRARILYAASHRTSIIVDCHSFPSEVAPDVDVCLGFNDDSSKPSDRTIESVAAIFREAGYSVALNRPYANALAPTGYIGHSLMIEVNKRTYMDESTLEKTDGFVKMRSVIEAVYKELLWNPYHLPNSFISWCSEYPSDKPEAEKAIAWEKIKRKIVAYTAERYGLPMPEDLSDSAKLDERRKLFRNDGWHPFGYDWGQWNGIMRQMLVDVFGRVGVELPPDAFIRGWGGPFSRRFCEREDRLTGIIS